MVGFGDPLEVSEQLGDMLKREADRGVQDEVEWGDQAGSAI